LPVKYFYRLCDIVVAVEQHESWIHALQYTYLIMLHVQGGWKK